jgi:hypothetical protein
MFPKKIATLGGDVYRDEYSASFDGSDDYMYISSITPFRDLMRDSFSISIWVKPADGQANDMWFGCRNSSNEDWFYIGTDTSGKIQIYLRSNDDPLHRYTDDYFPSGQCGWTHVIFSMAKSAVGGSNIYVNGQLKAEGNTNAITTGNWEAWSAGRVPYIGGINAAGTLSNIFTGNISDLVCYNKALSGGEAITIYNEGRPYNHREGIAQDNLHAWWRFGDGKFDDIHKDLSVVVNQSSEPVMSENLWDAAASTNGSVANWTANGSNTVVQDAPDPENKRIKITYVDDSTGAETILRDSKDLSSDLTVNKVYLLEFYAHVNTGSVTPTVRVSGGRAFNGEAITATSATKYHIYFRCHNATDHVFRIKDMSSGEIVYLDVFSLKELPLYSAIPQNMTASDFIGDVP